MNREPRTGFQFLSDFVSAHRGLRLGRLFGRPAAFAGRRVFACVMEDALIVKLPIDLARREIAHGARLHIRDGRIMRAWVSYRPRTSVAAQRLWPILEMAVRHAADPT
jgi:hypothetical protein